MATPPPDELEIAARLAARLCHDYASLAGSVVFGLDTLAGAPSADMRRMAEMSVDQGARRLRDLVVFARAAYGYGAPAGDGASLESVARGLFGEGRPALEWDVQAASLSPEATRALLILTQMAADLMGARGTVRVWARGGAGGADLRVEAEGPYVKLPPETAGGLSGEPLAEGRGDRWILASFLRRLLDRAGGKVGWSGGEAKVIFTAHTP